MSELGTDPTLIVPVTANFNLNATCACIYDQHPLGVWWTGSNWAIFHEDGAALTAITVVGTPGISSWLMNM